MRVYYFIIFLVVFCSLIYGQEGVTINGNYTPAGTVFVNKNGRITNVPSLSIYGQEFLLATLLTTSTSGITSYSALSGGNIISDAGSSVTVRGVCWNTSGKPTILDNKTNDGSGKGIFISSITNLTPNTQYYVRAYATNSYGTSYGDERVFNTLSLTFAPSELIATVISENEIRLSWNDNSENEDGFNIYCSTNNNIYTLLTKTASSVTNYIVPSLSTGYTYYFKVTAFRGTDESEAIIKGIPFYHWTINNYFILPHASDDDGIPVVSDNTSIFYAHSMCNFPLDSEPLWSVIYTCDIGYQDGDNYYINPSDDDLGFHTFKMDLLCNEILYASQTTNINVINKINTGSKTLLCFGNSVMYNYFNYEMNALKSVLSGMTLITVGTQTNHSDEGYYHDAISGYSYHAFTLFEASPFVKSAVINIPAYFSDYSITTPDIIYMRVGINDIGKYTANDNMLESDLNLICDNMESLIDPFLAYDPNIKVVIGLPNKPCLTNAQWDAAYPASAGKGSVFVKNLQRFYKKLIEEYRHPLYDERVYISYESFQLNRFNVKDIHPYPAGNTQIGLGLANTIAKIILDKK